MPSDIDAGSWNEMRVGKTCSRLLTQDHTEHRATACGLLQRADNDSTFLPSIYYREWTWVYGYDPETKQMSSQWTDAVITSAEESEASPVKCQENADRFL
jgi:hypothetical protein